MNTYRTLSCTGMTTIQTSFVDFFFFFILLVSLFFGGRGQFRHVLGIPSGNIDIVLKDHARTELNASGISRGVAFALLHRLFRNRWHCKNYSSDDCGADRVLPMVVAKARTVRHTLPLRFLCCCCCCCCCGRSLQTFACEGQTVMGRRQTGRQAGRQTDRQTDRQYDSQKIPHPAESLWIIIFLTGTPHVR